MVVGHIHYAWVVTAVTFVALLVAASVRAAPGVIILPLQSEFGWDRASISLAVSISLVTFGLGGARWSTASGRDARFSPASPPSLQVSSCSCRSATSGSSTSSGGS